MNRLKRFLFIFSLVGVLLSVKAFISNNRPPKNLGVKDRHLKDAPATPSGVSTQTQDEKKKVDPLLFLGTLEESKEEIERILSENPRIKIVENEEQYIRAVHLSKCFKFKDDFEFYFNDETLTIEFRAASRAGEYDFGMNRKWYKDIRNRYLSSSKIQR